MPDRLQPGKPPLRLREFAALCGVDYRTVCKWLDAKVVEFVEMPLSGERRIPVAPAASMLRSFGVIQ